MNDIIIPSVVAVVLSIVANLLTDRLKVWWATRALNSRARNAKLLRDELQLVTALKSSNQRLIIFSMSNLAISLGYFFGAILIAVIPFNELQRTPIFNTLLLVGILMLAYFGFRNFRTMADKFIKIIGFEEYQTDATKHLLQLDPTAEPIRSEPIKPSTEDVVSDVGFYILEAAYGAGHNWRDKTEILRGAIKDGKLNFYVHNNNLGGDHFEYEKKYLKITYSYNGVTQSRTYSENETVELP